LGRKINANLGRIVPRECEGVSEIEMSTQTHTRHARLAPGIHQFFAKTFSEKMDCRVEPGNDGMSLTAAV
jgi:hypothetical protein